MSCRFTRLAALVAACAAAGSAFAQAGQPLPPIALPPVDAQPAPQSAPRTKPASDRCNTPMINCILSERQPRGSSCWCATPFGPSYGRVP